MPEPISTALGFCLAYAAFSYRRNDSALSIEAKSSETAVASVMKEAENSWALFGQKSAAISSLHKIAEECSMDDWDGNGAEAIYPLAVWNAEDFIRALPDNIPLPELAPEPDGSISLDWIRSRHRIFSLSIGLSNRVAFAWLDGTDKGHGVSRFDGVMPSHVLTELRPIIGRWET